MFADVLIPGGAGLPSASQADVHGKWIDRVLNARPDLAPDLLALLEQGSGEDPRKELQRCREEMPEVFETFTLAVSGAYFMNPRVRKALGYPGTAPKRKPAYPDEADFYLDGGALVEPVVARGPIYRSTPAGESTQ
jgi:hypothetical protein